MATIVTFAARRRLASPDGPNPAAPLSAIVDLLDQIGARETDLVRYLSDLDRGIADLLRQREAMWHTLSDLRQSLATLERAACSLRGAAADPRSR